MTRLLAPRRLFLANVDAAFEVCPVLDHDALSNNISGKNGGLPQFNAVHAGDVAVDSALNHNLLGIDVRANASVRTDGQVVIVQFDAAFNFPVNVQILTPRKFTLDHDGLADMGTIGSILLAASIRIHETDLLTSLPGLRA